ncbi:uncharacterized protein MELLADRAFT_88329 [Melampsora larici-populina 98AG31]|uniref:Uncharacterized protein n=1 Tax=Melampsora larici-populina (strain 98AG31 / pathotype 3-4-7) TaxID=747676 RepID=F4RRC2_MELLP|nr:uncharacterized protein MELLADRAFT_88329 [Melampsora larici-populina 98AG31]EGG05058.1 hypothetical protein MELLADRAFT_88329 [Melampsora larici-populina 98AG31]
MALRNQIDRAANNLQRRLTRAEAAATGTQLEERLVTPRRNGGRRQEQQEGIRREEQGSDEEECSHVPRLNQPIPEEDEEWGGIGEVDGDEQREDETDQMDIDQIEKRIIKGTDADIWGGSFAIPSYSEARREALVELIQDAYDRDDDAGARRLTKRLNKEDGVEEPGNPYVMDEESSKSSDDEANVRSFLVTKVPPEAPSVTFVCETQRQGPADRDQPAIIKTTATSALKETVDWFQGCSSQEESDKAKALMTAKKGSLTLSNSDMIHNGRVFRSGPAKMGDAITPLSPHLTLKLKGLKSFIPLPVFDEEFLIRDQMAWSLLPPKSEDKADKEKRLYGGEGPKEELTMDFEAWSDCMELMCVHLRDQDWGPVADQFESHMVIVKQLRKDFGWMVALRYCRLVRQGVMRETIDSSMGNWAELQDHLLAQAKTKAESYNERYYRTNPYPENGPKANICPYTNQTKTSQPVASTSSTTFNTSYTPNHHTSVNRHATGSSYRGNGGGKRNRGAQPWNRDRDRDVRGPRWGDEKRKERSKSPERRHEKKGNDGRWKRS